MRPAAVGMGREGAGFVVVPPGGPGDGLTWLLDGYVGRRQREMAGGGACAIAPVGRAWQRWWHVRLRRWPNRRAR